MAQQSAGELIGALHQRLERLFGKHQQLGSLAPGDDGIIAGFLAHQGLGINGLIWPKLLLLVAVGLHHGASLQDQQ